MDTLGRYRLGAEVARGASGAVHQGTDPGGRRVAIKLLHPWRAADARHRRRFEAEVQALLRVRHENVVAILDAGEHAGTPYLVMEWVEGESLGDRLVRRGPFSPRAAARLIERLARALEASHEQGVLHRDVKPGNVLLRSDDAEGAAPLLTDFGLARDVLEGASVRTAEGQALGTPGFWPPEQARGDQASVGPRSDVYSLGALLYATLTGRSPQSGRSLPEMVASSQKLPAPPSSVSREVDPRLDAICLRCLEPHPGARWSSAGALADALHDYLEGKEPRRRSPLGRLAAVGGLAALAAAIWAVALRIGDRPPPEVEKSTAASTVSSGAVVKPPLAKAGTLQELLDRAAALLVAGDRAGAFRELDRAVALDPRSAAPWAARAEANARSGREADALKDIESALSLAPERLDLVLLRAEVRLQGTWREPFDLSAVEADLERVLARDPREARALAAKAQVRDMIEDPQGALALVEQALAIDPHQDRAWYIRSVLNRRKGDWPAALKDLDNAIRSAPERADYLLERGEGRAYTGDTPGSERDFAQAVQLGADQPRVWVRLGMHRQSVGDEDGALADFEKALELDPGEAMARCQRGQIRASRGDPTGARADYDVALEAEPRLTMAWHYRGCVRLDQEDWTGAIADFDQALALSPDHPWVLMDRADAREALKDLAGARADYDRVLELDAEHFPSAFFHRGRVRKESGDLPGALTDLQKSLECEDPPWKEEADELIEEVKKLMAGPKQ